MKEKILYISYNGLLEPILDSQAIPYMRGLNAALGIEFVLFTFEKKKNLLEYGPQRIKQRKEDLRKNGIKWVWARYHKSPHFLAKLIDLTSGFIATFILLFVYKISSIHARSAIAGVMAIIPAKFMRKKFLFDMRASLSDEAIGLGLARDGSLKHSLLNIVEKILLESSDGIVVLTKKHYGYLGNRFIMKKRPKAVEVIPCCVDLDKFRLIPRDKAANKEERKFTFMYLGKFGSLYLIEELLDYFIVYKKLFPNSQILFVTQDDSTYVYNACKEKRINFDDIRVYKPKFEEIPDLISQADCGIFFINPKRKFASFPIKLGEFLSCGVPVVINSGIGDTQELVEKYRVGVVVKDFSVDSYRHTSGLLQDLIKEGNALRYRCRKAAERELSLDIGVARYRKIYNALDLI